jgi:hypothetical protein
MRWLMKVAGAGLWATVTPLLAMAVFTGIEPGTMPDSDEIALIIGLGIIMVFLPTCFFTALIGIPIAAWLEGAKARATTHLIACAGAFAAVGFIWAIRPALGDSARMATDSSLRDQLLAFTLLGANLGLAWSVLNLWIPPLPNWETENG